MWHVYSESKPDKDKDCLVQMKSGESWVANYSGNDFWLIFVYGGSAHTIDYSKYDDLSNLHDWEIIEKWVYLDDII